MTSTTLPNALTALLVEDDSAIALVVATVLQREGWTVEQCADGEAAIASDIAPLDLLITDLNLPGGVNGLEIARHFRERATGARLGSHGVAVVLMSGDYEVRGLASDGMVQLPKPFRRAALLDAIVEARTIVKG